MTYSPSQVRADFDRLALLSEEGWSHNSHYHLFLLRQLPARLEVALDVGCGTGAFSRLLARRSDRVLGLDLSPLMIRLAKERSRAYPNVDYEVADVLERELPAEAYSCIASIATLHHLPLRETLLKLKGALRPGGTLLILDLFEPASVTDRLVGAAGVPAGLVLKLVKTGRLGTSAQEREAWAEHGRHDVYPTLAQVRQVCAGLLPGAAIRRHLLWRYSIVWRKPAG